MEEEAEEKEEERAAETTTLLHYHHPLPLHPLYQPLLLLHLTRPMMMGFLQAMTTITAAAAAEAAAAATGKEEEEEGRRIENAISLQQETESEKEDRHSSRV